MTWKQLPSLARGNDFWETNAGEFPELQQQLEVAVAVGSCGHCWKLRQVAGEAHNMTKMLFLYFNCYPDRKKHSLLKDKYFREDSSIHYLHSKIFEYAQ